MQVSWTPLAVESYQNIIDQLVVDWNIDITEHFASAVEKLIDKIQNHHHICPKSQLKHLHKCVINKQNSLIYRVKDSSNIEIILFIFNKSEHIF